MATNQADPGSDGVASLSMDDLRARLDAPLFHRDQGLSTPVVPIITAGVVQEEGAVVPPPTPSLPYAQPQLASFSELMSMPAVRKEPEVASTPEAPTPPPLGPAETDALLAVLAAFESSANKMYERDSRASDPVAPVVAAEVVPEAIMPLPVAALNITPAHGQRSSIEAELNRLAFLPDQAEPVGRVEIPQIAMAHSEPRAMGVPSLSQHEMYNPRATPAMPTARRVSFEAAFEGSSRRRRARRGVVRRLFSLVLTLAIIGGALYAAKYYLLDPKWDSDVKVLVDDVQVARGLQFDHAVEVTSLAANDYATRIASYGLDIHGGNQAQVGSEFHALGLLAGTLDLQAIGLAALPETPAFYDAGSERIYVVAGLPIQTYRFAMYRALDTALLDQTYGWGSRIEGAAPAVVRGTRALYEADAISTASSMLTDADRALVLEQRQGLYTTFAAPITPSQFATTVAGRLGVSLRAFIESFPTAERDRVLRDATISDSQALDIRRLVRGVADAAPDPQDVLRKEASPDSGSQGMLFWYHVLASRLDVATAWNNALPIQSDEVVVTAGATGYCVTAVLTVPSAALDGVTAAFTAWASAAPAESATTVAPTLGAGFGQIAINACDAGLALPTNNGQVPLSLGGAPLRTEQYRVLLIEQPTLTAAQAACAVYGGDTVSAADERLVVDAVEGWSAPTTHPAPDSTAECASV